MIDAVSRPRATPEQEKAARASRIAAEARYRRTIDPTLGVPLVA
jgi:hypothetical protein